MNDGKAVEHGQTLTKLSFYTILADLTGFQWSFQNKVNSSNKRGVAKKSVKAICLIISIKRVLKLLSCSNIIPVLPNWLTAFDVFQFLLKIFYCLEMVTFAYFLFTTTNRIKSTGHSPSPAPGLSCFRIMVDDVCSQKGFLLCPWLSLLRPHSLAPTTFKSLPIGVNCIPTMDTDLCHTRTTKNGG